MKGASMKKRILSFVLALITCLSIMIPLGAVTTVDAAVPSITPEYRDHLLSLGFPESYIPMLAKLHEQHPNWTFTPLKITDLKSTYTWDYVISQMMASRARNLVTSSSWAPSPYTSLGHANYDPYREASLGAVYDSGWYAANQKAIKYFMDPRNFLNDTDCFMFLDWHYEGNTVTEEQVEAVLGTCAFAHKVIPDLDGHTTYAQYLVQVGTELGVDPMFLATRLRLENGNGTSPMVNGTTGDYLGIPKYNGYYNFYNINAGGTGTTEIYTNGMEEAMTGTPAMASQWGGSGAWNTRWKAIYGGAYVLKTKYVAKYKNTLYLQKFNTDPRATGNFSGYMQNIAAPLIEGRSFRKSVVNSSMLDSAYNFQIPVYSGMPTSPCADPGNGSVYYSYTEAPVTSYKLVLPAYYNAFEMGASGAVIAKEEAATVTYTVQSGYADEISLRGWSVSTAGTRSFYYTIDGGTTQYPLAAEQRLDVFNGGYMDYSAYCDSTNIGYNGSFDASTLDMGDHTIQIYAVNNSGGSYLSATVTIIVEGPPSSANVYHEFDFTKYSTDAKIDYEIVPTHNSAVTPDSTTAGYVTFEATGVDPYLTIGGLSASDLLSDKPANYLDYVLIKYQTVNSGTGSLFVNRTDGPYWGLDGTTVSFNYESCDIDGDGTADIWRHVLVDAGKVWGNSVGTYLYNFRLDFLSDDSAAGDTMNVSYIRFYANAADANMCITEDSTTTVISDVLTITHAKAPTAPPEASCEHNYVTTTVAPTCSKMGSTFDECTKCGHTTAKKKIPALGHTMTYTAAQAPTCTTAGTLSYYTCSVCNLMFADEEGKTQLTSLVAPATGHTAGAPVKENEIPETNTVDGSYDSVIYCTVCNTEISRTTVVIPAKGLDAFETVALTGDPVTNWRYAGQILSVNGVTNIGAVGYRDSTTKTIHPATMDASSMTLSSITLSGWAMANAGQSKIVWSVDGTTWYECRTITYADASSTQKDTAISYATLTSTSASKGAFNNLVIDLSPISGKTVDLRLAVIPSGSASSICHFVTLSGLHVGVHTHSYGSWVTMSSPTCTTAGSQRRTCYCGVTEEQSIAATGHTIVTVAATAATCTTPGTTEGKKCSVCQTWTIPQTTVAATGHSYGAWTTATAATCTAAGSQSRTCSSCSDVETKIIAALGHSYGAWTTSVAPTCINTGTETRTCSICYNVETNATAALGHSYGGWTTTVAPTCTAMGTQTRTCSVCQNAETNMIPATGHIEITVAGTAATCTTAGKTTGRQCSVCKVWTLEQTIIPAGHSYGEWVITKAATCTETGTMTRSCTACGVALDTRSIDKTSHTAGSVSSKNPTCTESGYKITYCATCSVEMAHETYDATGHFEGAWIVDQAATCTSSGSRHISCTVCQITLRSETVPPTDHTYGAWIMTQAPTCTVAGTETSTCTSCSAYKQQSIAAKGHVESGWIVDREATATTAGSKHTSCTVCGEIMRTASIPATGGGTTTCQHNATSWIEVRAATCTVSGEMVERCNICNETLATRTITAAGHSESIIYGKAETCTEAGLTNGKVCTVCEQVLEEQRIIPAAGHDEHRVSGTSATCTENGLSEGTVCGTCHAVLTAQTAIPAKGHIAGAWSTDREATCTENGVKRVACTVCEAVMDEDMIPATGHTASGWRTVEHATCSLAGVKVKTCMTCGEELETAVIPATEEHELSWITTKKATCTEEGARAKICGICQAVLSTEAIPAEGHTEKTVRGTQPTCTESGMSDGAVCAVCHVVLTAQTELAAKGHSESDWILDKLPDVGVEGAQHTVCSVCGVIVSNETIPALKVPEATEPVTTPESEPATSTSGETEGAATETEATTTSAETKTDEEGCGGVIISAWLAIAALGAVGVCFVRRKEHD